MGPRRFTLVELMIVVAIIAVLAAIAIPLFRDFQLRARLAELPTNGEAIMKLAYLLNKSGGALPGYAINPTSDPAQSLRDWPAGTTFDTLGFQPDGGVRCSYEWAGGCIVDMYCDLDGDGTFVRIEFGTFGSEPPFTVVKAQTSSFWPGAGGPCVGGPTTLTYLTCASAGFY